MALNLYLAYGSNLNKTAMKRRCVDARPLARIMLTNARLVFRGVADLEYDPVSTVPCGIWSISRDDEKRLDAYEGINSGLYFKDRSILIKYRGEYHHPLIYLMRSEGVYPPCQDYVNTIRKGYQDFSLDESFLDEAIEHSYNHKNPDRQTRERRVRQRRDMRTLQLVEMPESIALKRFATEGGSNV